MNRYLAWTLTLLLLASACTGGGDDHADRSADASKYSRGGTLRVASDHWTFDPQITWDPLDWELFRCCLLRTLFTYNGGPTEEGGAILRPDLADGMGSLSPDGSTWTFTLKDGIRYAPPFQDVAITSADIVRALEREGTLGVSYADYYRIIEGFAAFEAGKVDSISGITVPNDHTLVVRLNRPSGDLPYLLTMPATAPIPPGASEGHDDDYERFLVSSGPYMIEGSKDLDFSGPPDQQEPVSGYTPNEFDEEGVLDSPGSLTLVRNPSWDRDSDDVRGALVDRIEVALRAPGDSHERRRLEQIERGELDLSLGDSLSQEDADRYRADPSLIGGILGGQQNGLGFFQMSLATPPFDDLDVRRAVMLVLDREALLREGGIPIAGSADLAEHLSPDSLEGGLLTSYDPYPDHRGDLGAAKRAMAASAYDHDGDGVCDDPVCRDLLAAGVAQGVARSDDEAFLAQSSLREIGIRVHIRFFQDNFDSFDQLVAGRIAITLNVPDEWFADYPSGSQMFTNLYSSRVIENPGTTATECCNGTMIGASPDQLRSLGFDPISVPSVDDRIDRCMVMRAPDQPECWAILDEYMMEQVLPVIPIMIPRMQTPFSTRVAHASIDQWTTAPALDQVALVPGSN